MLTREEKLKAVATAFMADDPQEYAGETVEDVVEQLKTCSDKFLDHAYDSFVVGGKH